MRIVIVVPSLGRGGAERVAVELAGRWAHLHAVTIVALSPAAPALASPVHLITLGARSSASFGGKLLAAPRRVARLRRCLRALAPDVIVSFMEAANLPSILAARGGRRGARLIATVHTDFRRHRRATRALMRLLYPGTTLVVPAEGLARELEAGRIGTPGRVHVIPNPHAPRRLPLAPLPPLPERYLLALGRLAPEKDFTLLLRGYAIAAARLEIPDLVIAGEGPERAGLVAEARRLGLARRAHFPGFVEDVGGMLARAELLLVTSEREGWSTAIVEALAAGCPVVSVDCPFGPREILGGGRWGVLVPGRAPAALAQAITDTLGDAARRERLRREGPARAAQFEAGTVAARWEELLRGTA
jgi:glycosyltransferase involved in cell wall biosynthesis